MSKKIGKFAPKTNIKHSIMKEFSATNFRKFENLPTMEFGGVNLLVGGNNAGKSTFVKAMLVFGEFLKYWKNGNNEMPFDSPIFRLLHINSFSDLTNYNSPTKDLELYASFDKVSIRLLFDPNTEHSGVSLKKCLISSKTEGGNLVFSVDYIGKNIRFELPSSEKKTINPIKKEDSGASYFLRRAIQNDKKLEDAQKDYEILSKARTKIDSEEHVGALERIIETFEKHSQKKDPKADGQMFRFPSEVHRIRMVDVLSEYLNFIKNLKFFEDTYVFTCPLPDGNTNFVSAIGPGRIQRKEDFYELVGLFYYFYRKNELALQASKVGSDKLYELNERVSEILNLFEMGYCRIFNIALDKVFLYKETGDIPQTINSFMALEKSNPEKAKLAKGWIKKWMKEFGLGVDFKTKELVEKEAFDIAIMRSNDSKNQVPLSSFGMGSIHMFILLMKIAINYLVFSTNKQKERHLERHLEKGSGYSLLFVEEPELNLHPNYQSKLADLFLDAHERFGIQFFVETHSEYLVRKSLVLTRYRVDVKNSTNDEIVQVAEKDYKSPFKVFFFPGDSVPYDLGLRPDGYLSKSIGTGFLDEADKLASLL